MEDISSSLAAYGYVALFFYSLGGGFIGLSIASALAFAGKMDIFAVIATAYVANFIGDIGLIWLARNNKEIILPYIKKHRRKFAYSHLLMKKYGSIIIIFQKFVYGLKTLVPVAIGFTKYDFTKFLFFNAIGSLVFVLFFGVLGYFSAEFVFSVSAKISDNPWIAPLALGILLFVVYKIFKKIDK